MNENKIWQYNEMRDIQTGVENTIIRDGVAEDVDNFGEGRFGRTSPFSKDFPSFPNVSIIIVCIQKVIRSLILDC
ncbi:hypothetical protein FF1_041397 [Malus domestica]